MKRCVSVLWIGFLSLSSSLVFGQQVILTLNMVSPMPARLSEWQRNPALIIAVVTNQNPAALQNVAFSFTLQDLTANLTVASSKDGNPAIPHFTIPPGTTTLNGAAIINLNAVNINQNYRTVATTTGSLPEGQYELCLRLLDHNGNPIEVTGRLCATCLVILPDPPTLIRPANGDSIPIGTLPQFVWTPVQGGGQPVRYRLRIAPVFSGQDPRFAMDNNEALLSHDTPVTSYQYLPSDPPFALYPTTSRFAWQVQAVSDSGTPLTRNEGKSEINEFNTTTRETTITETHCGCTSDPRVESVSKASVPWKYRVVGTFACTGGTTTIRCSVRNTTYAWRISSGGDVAAIDGPADGSSVDVRPLKSGSFVLAVNVTVECTDGTTCTGYTNSEETVPPTTTSRECAIAPDEKADPAMDGGLDPRFMAARTIRRDDFIPLKAVGLDYDKLTWKCTPSSECPETQSEKTIPLTGRVRFEWSIDAGEGSFVQLGCLPDSMKSGDGDFAIFKPPYVPLPDKGDASSKTTTIKLKVIDDNPTQPIDKTVERVVTITTKRKKDSPDLYEIEVKSDKFKLPAVPKDPEIIGTCKATGPTWEQDKDLTIPDISKPSVADNDKMVVGQWIILTANDQRDGDKVTVNCLSEKCTSTKYEKVYEDNVAWKWSIVSGGGRFVTSLTGDGGEPIGRNIIYEAPLVLPDGTDEKDIVIAVEVYNPEGLQIVDKKPDVKKITLKVYRAGVKVEQTPLAWLPTEDNSVEKKSYLVYKDGTWKPALAHMCRIHFFELSGVSKEKGICMNVPLAKDANKCPDLFLKDEAGHESFNDKGGSGDCKKKGSFQEARTKQPVKEYTITVYSEDYGSYGFLSSFANINRHSPGSQKSERPYYESVPVKKGDVVHPAGRPLKTEYADNRVTVPRDIDENHIADGGWTATGGVAVPDPENNTEDTDGSPNGDAYTGDGLTTYEEYRGFKVITPAVTHERTNPSIKDVFVYNENSLPTAIYQAVTSLNVHEISEDQYNKNNSRYINFNFGTMHETNQRGLWLRNGGTSASLLGICNSTTGNPAPPNWVNSVVVYQTSITTFCTRQGLNFNAKLNQVTAHELSHAVNVYHHGEAIGSNQNNVHGTRSGDMSCVMRYDNLGNGVEAIGTILCTNPRGTGTNANNQGFGDAARGRGNCIAQIRVSGKASSYPTR